MIVKMDSTNFNLYREFFSEAYKYLEKLENDSINESTGEKTIIIIKDDDRDDENKSFTSISQYFKYIEYFRDSPKKDYFLLKLPLDENTLDIDANTRLIDTQGFFSKNSIVQRDKIAETIVFTINRFIDNIDLCNVDEIYVQWTAPDGKGGIREWATPVSLIDRDSFSEKIKFGWTIDDEVTLYPGKVSFAVTLFIKDKNSIGEVLYRLNTLPVSFEVKSALQPEINANSVLNRPNNALHAAICNNKYFGNGNPEPLKPDFGLGIGEDLQETALLAGDGEGTLTLRAQAVTNDTGNIKYTWYFVPEGGGDFRYCCGEKPSEESLNYSITFKVKKNGEDRLLNSVDYELLTSESQSYFEVIESNEEDKKVFYKLKNDPGTDSIELTHKIIGTVGVLYEVAKTPLNKMDRYFVKTETGVWEEYNGSVDQQELPKYEKYTTFTVSETGKVVGEYYVEATNEITPNISAPQQSVSCFLKGPDEIIIIKDLAKDLFIESKETYSRKDILYQSDYDLIIDKDKDSRFSWGIDEDGRRYYSPNFDGTTVNTQKVTLDLEIAPTEDTAFVYKWYKSLTENSVGNEITGADGTSFTVSDIGWYQVNISANKNREDKFEKSIVCRAVNSPIAPTLDIVEFSEGEENTTSAYGSWYNYGQPDSCYVIDANINDEVNLIVQGSIPVDSFEKAEDITETSYSAGQYYYKNDYNKYVIDESENFNPERTYYNHYQIDQKNNKLYSDGIQYEWRIFDEKAGNYVVLNLKDHANLIPSPKNNSFSDAEENEKFSSHPEKLVIKFLGTKLLIACFAINTLHTRDTINESVAVSFEIR